MSAPARRMYVPFWSGQPMSLFRSKKATCFFKPGGMVDVVGVHPGDQGGFRQVQTRVEGLDQAFLLQPDVANLLVMQPRQVFSRPSDEPVVDGQDDEILEASARASDWDGIDKVGHPVIEPAEGRKSRPGLMARNQKRYGESSISAGDFKPLLLPVPLGG